MTARGRSIYSLRRILPQEKLTTAFAVPWRITRLEEPNRYRLSAAGARTFGVITAKMIRTMVRCGSRLSLQVLSKPSGEQSGRRASEQLA
jgi:hypothetical protein